MAGSSTAALKFAVRRRPAVLVAPASPTPHELKPLSDIDDQEVLRAHIALILFYRHDPSMGARDPAPVIRGSVARALVHYYPLAGRLRELGGRKLAVDCTGEGVLFTEADADVRLDHLGDPLLPPFPCIEELVFDVPGSSAVVDAPLLLVQVTRLACGGFVLAVRENHSMADAPGLVQFVAAVAELARGAEAPAVRPVWRRELLRARDPPWRPCFAHREYDDRGAQDTTTPPLDDDDAVHRCFFFAPRDVDALRGLLAPGRLRASATTFDLLTGCLWKCRTEALAPDAGEEMRVICVVNARRGGGIPSGYYGNAFALPVAISTAGELRASPLSYAVGLVKRAKAEVDMEYMRSVADLMAHRGRPCMALVNTFVLSDLTKAARVDLDFGWGKPAYAGPALGTVTIPGTGTAFSFFVPFTDASGEEGIVVPMCLPRVAMSRFEEELVKLLQRPPIDVVAAQQKPRSAL
ncbi:hypothetical protein ACP70R_021139 [Stipagrostis hirtigluma subsp. patula]